jgi:hypothetical protein
MLIARRCEFRAYQQRASGNGRLCTRGCVANGLDVHVQRHLRASGDEPLSARRF